MIKNHPKSIFVRAKQNDTIFDPTNPRCVFPKAETYMQTKYEPRAHYVDGRWQSETYKVEAKRDKEVPCVVLQAMIIGEDSFLCEIVTVDDFYGGVNDVQD